jgi:hypothetical protein
MNARCTCSRSWGLHSRNCALYAPGHELAAQPAALRCARCGDEDGPWTPDDLCENCARAVAL